MSGGRQRERSFDAQPRQYTDMSRSTSASGGNHEGGQGNYRGGPGSSGGGRVQNCSKSVSIEQSKQIKQRSNNWRAMLDYADNACANFSDINWRSLFSKLGQVTQGAAALRNNDSFKRLWQRCEGVEKARDTFYSAQNKQIMQRGNNWRAMLDYAENTCGNFNDVNWRAVFSKLGQVTQDAAALRNNDSFKRLWQRCEGVERARDTFYIAQNKQIMERSNNWRAMLDYAENTCANFNDFNWRGLFIKLGEVTQGAAALRNNDSFKRLWQRCEGVERARDQLYIGQNKQLGAFAQSGNWRGMLDYAQNTCSTFDHVCWATLFNKLGKMKQEAAAISSDIVFRRLVHAFERRAVSEGLGLSLIHI